MKAFLVIGLGFGDEGKGATVDYLTRKHGAKLVVRFNGGCQAAHNVVTSDGRHHTFSQFGSGTLAGARTHLSRFVAVSPEHLRNEADHLRRMGLSHPYRLLTADPEALVTVPLHVVANRVREFGRGKGAHGSCGVGFGETIRDSLRHPKDVLRMKHLQDPPTVRRLLDELRSRLMADPDFGPLEREALANRSVLAKSLGACESGSYVPLCDDVEALTENEDRPVIFEGAQGVLLDETHGFHPHTTWSTTTFKNAEQLLMGFAFEEERIGVLRTMQTRHGAGPLPTEDPESLALIQGDHNKPAVFQGAMRAGVLDLVLCRYALRAAGGVDGLAMTYAERVPATGGRLCTAYYEDVELPQHDDFPVWPNPERTAPLTEMLRVAKPRIESVPAESLCDVVAERLGVPLRLLSYGPTAADRVSR